MSRVSMFSSPLLLGFDQFERTLDRIGKTAEGYPPYNIEQLSENRLRIILAVAGFAREDLDIVVEANQLSIRGRQKDQSERVFVYRGIAARQFQRSFVLADGLEVSGAELVNGLLSIEIVRPVVESVVRTIPIRNGTTGDGQIAIAGGTPRKE